MNVLYTDYLVIGSGVAGLRAAIELASFGKVLVVTKDVPTESSTEYAQGGVAVALSDEDRVGIHLEDTLKAGDGLCREDAVRVLVEEGPQRIIELIDWGAEFDKDGSRLAFTMEAAHSRRRILHAQGDSTGREIERVLISKARTFGVIERYPFSIAVDLIVDKGECRGALVLKDGAICAVHARSTILATGGAGQVYVRTTNPMVTTGDGIAIAYRAGAVTEDMEFVQFHPTALFAPGAPHFLLSEAMRGEGALLRDANHDLFMKQYHERAELAPRDVVSRAIISHMVKTGGSHVFMDLRHLDAAFVRKRFPKIHSTCLQYGVDITDQLVPVSPAAHYIMGGVKTDLEGATNIPGLFAAGEVACTGVHGGNRLASNSLLEGLVYGYRAGREAGAYGMSQKGRELDQGLHDRISEGLRTQREPDLGNHDVSMIREGLRRLMWDRAGIIRCGVSLTQAIKTIEEWEDVHDMRFTERQGIELKNMVCTASLIIGSAVARRGSVGAHYRSDFPLKTEGWERHFCVHRNESGMRITTCP